MTVPRHLPPVSTLTRVERERMRMEGVRIGRVVLWSGCSTIPCQCRAWGKIRCRGWGGMTRNGEQWCGESRGCGAGHGETHMGVRSRALAFLREVGLWCGGEP